MSDILDFHSLYYRKGLLLEKYNTPKCKAVPRGLSIRKKLPDREVLIKSSRLGRTRILPIWMFRPDIEVTCPKTCPAALPVHWRTKWDIAMTSSRKNNGDLTEYKYSYRVGKFLLSILYFWYLKFSLII